MTASLLATGLASKKPFAADDSLVIWLCELILLCITTYLSYVGAINRAVAWGDQVKGVFDLYRWDLLKQLGYEQKPIDRSSERELWTEISKQIFYGDPIDGKPWPYAEKRLPVSCSPADVVLQVASGTSDLLFRKAVKIHYRIKNIDPQGRPANDLVLTVDVPSTWMFRWNSAKVFVGDISRMPSLTGTNPPCFCLGQLGFGHEIEFECVFNLIGA